METYRQGGRERARANALPQRRNKALDRERKRAPLVNTHALRDDTVWNEEHGRKRAPPLRAHTPYEGTYRRLDRERKRATPLIRIHPPLAL